MSFKTPDHVRQEWADKHGLPNFASQRYSNALEAVCKRQGVSISEPHQGARGVARCWRDTGSLQGCSASAEILIG